MSKKKEVHIHLEALIGKVEINTSNSKAIVTSIEDQILEDQILEGFIKSLLNTLIPDQDTSEIQTKQALFEKGCIKSRGERIDDFFRPLRYCKNESSHSMFTPCVLKSETQTKHKYRSNAQGKDIERDFHSKNNEYPRHEG